MSLPSFDIQRSFLDADQICGTVLSQSGANRFKLFRETVWPVLAEQRPLLEKMYCRENGRPAEEPVRMLGVLILQFMERLPDRKAAEACTYDLRWKHALDLEVDEVSFHPTSLVKFRNRLLEHDLQALGFDAVLESMREAGYARKKVCQRVDSTHIVGMVSWMSRLECVRETMRLTLQCLANQKDLPRPELWSGWWERYVESLVDYRAAKEELVKKMEQTGRDIYTVLQWAGGQSLSKASADALALLQRVFDENFEVREDAVSQRRAQPAGAVHNPHDPEAQWSTKSTICTRTKEWVGYKSHVAESVEEPVKEKNEPTRAVLTAVITERAPASDKSAIKRVELEMRDRGELLPETLYADAGYNSAAEIARFKAEGRSLEGPVQPAPRKGKRFCSEDFDVAVETRTAVCPAGKTNTQCSRLEEAGDKVSFRFEWSTACRGCALFDQCVTPGQSHRTLTVREHHTHLQSRRREMKTDTFRMRMHRRNGIEGTISELVRGHGFRRSRYRGEAKTRLQNLMTGAACNLKRWSRRIEWESLEGPCLA